MSESNKSSNNSSLQHFWSLALTDTDARLEAAGDIVSQHCCDTKLTGVEAEEQYLYTLSRLVRGLSSSRLAARQGFATALSSLLHFKNEKITEETHPVLTLLDQHTQIVTSSMKMVEQREKTFAKLFGYMAVIRSEVLSDSLRYNLLIKVLELSQWKSWITPVCIEAFISAIGQETPASYQEHLKAPVDQIVFHEKALDHASQIALSLFLKQSKFDNEIVLSIDQNVALQTTSSVYPSVHFVWNFVLQESNDNILECTWNNVVDEMLLNPKVATHERRGLALKLFEFVMKNSKLSSGMKLENLILCLYNNSVIPNAILHDAASHVLSQVSISNPMGLYEILTKVGVPPSLLIKENDANLSSEDLKDIQEANEKKSRTFTKWVTKVLKTKLGTLPDVLTYFIKNNSYEDIEAVVLSKSQILKCKTLGDDLSTLPSFCVIENNEASSSSDVAISIMEFLKDLVNTESKNKDDEEFSVSSGLLLLSLVYQLMYDEDEDENESLCRDALSSIKSFVSKDYCDEATMVLLEVLMSLMTRESGVTRSLVKRLFKNIVNSSSTNSSVIEDAITNMVQVIISPANPTTNAEDMMQVDDSNTTSSEEEESSSSDDESPITNDKHDDSEEEIVVSLDDALDISAQMEREDNALANIVTLTKEKSLLRKQTKKKKLMAVNFRLRLVDLLSTFVKKQNFVNNAQVVLNLLKFVNKSSSASPEECSLRASVLSLLRKASNITLTQEAGIQTLVNEIILKSNSKEVSSVCTSVLLSSSFDNSIIKTCVNSFLTDKKTRVSVELFEKMIKKSSSSSLLSPIISVLIDRDDEISSDYHRCEAFRLVTLILKQQSGTVEEEVRGLEQVLLKSLLLVPSLKAKRAKLVLLFGLAYVTRVEPSSDLIKAFSDTLTSLRSSPALANIVKQCMSKQPRKKQKT